MFGENDAEIYKFPNGATLLYKHDSQTKTTKIASGFISGSKKDVIPGTAHFLEHILATPRTVQKALAKKYNIKISASTAFDFICFQTSSSSQYIEKQLQILKEIVLCDEFDQKTIERERQAILIEDVLSSARPKTIDFNFFDIQPSGTGGEQNIKKITSDDLKNYKDENFVAENFVMAVTSNLSFDKIKKYAEDVVSNLTSKPLKKNSFHQIKKKPDISYYVYEQNPFMKTVRLELSIKNDEISEIAARNKIIDDYIFNYSTGLLHQKLRHENGYAYFAKLTNNFGENNDNYKIFAVDTNKRSVNKVIFALGEALKIARNGLSQQEYEDFECALKAQKDEEFQQKEQESYNMFVGYSMKGYFVFENPIDMALKLSRDELNQYLNTAYTDKSIVLNITGDIDLNTLLKPPVVQSTLQAKPFRYLLIKGDKNYFFDTKTNNFVDPSIIKDNSVAFYKVRDSHGKLVMEPPKIAREVKGFAIPKSFKNLADDEKQQ